MNLLYSENEIEAYEYALWKQKYEAKLKETEKKKLKVVKVDTAA